MKSLESRICDLEKNVSVDPRMPSIIVMIFGHSDSEEYLRYAWFDDESRNRCEVHRQVGEAKEAFLERAQRELGKGLLFVARDDGKA